MSRLTLAVAFVLLHATWQHNASAQTPATTYPFTIVATGNITSSSFLSQSSPGWTNSAFGTQNLVGMRYVQTLQFDDRHRLAAGGDFEYVLYDQGYAPDTTPVTSTLSINGRQIEQRHADPVFQVITEQFGTRLSLSSPSYPYAGGVDAVGAGFYSACQSSYSSVLYDTCRDYVNISAQRVGEGFVTPFQSYSAAGFTRAGFAWRHDDLEIFGAIDSISVLSAPAPTCIPPAILRGTDCIPPTPTPFFSRDLSLPQGMHDHGADSLLISFDGRAFRVDFPLFLEGAVGVAQALLDKWIDKINETWGSFRAFDQSGGDYSIDFNAYWTTEKSEALSVVNVSSKVGSTNPPCRFIPVGDFSLERFDCQVPKVDDNVVSMYSVLQQFCYADTNNSTLIDCATSDHAVRMVCLDTDGSIYIDKRSGLSYICYDLGAYLPFVAVHEFGHVLGLPDEYHPFGTKETLCLAGSVVPATQCEYDGLMGYGHLVQQRYFTYLFDQLSSLTPEFDWTFGMSPDFIGDFPGGLVERIGLVELPLSQSDNQIGLPPTITLVVAALAALRLSTSRRRRNISIGVRL